MPYPSTTVRCSRGVRCIKTFVFTELLVYIICAAIALGIFAEEGLDVFSIFSDTLLVAVVAIDEDEQVTGGEGHLGALVIAGRGAHTPLLVTIDG